MHEFSEAARDRPKAVLDQPDPQAWTLMLDTEVDVAGNARAERLTIDARKLKVSSLTFPAECRQWRLNEIEDVRIEPAIGSCFLRAQVQGQWVDVLRRPGNADEELTRFVELFHARSGLGGWPWEPGRDAAASEPRPSQWLSGGPARHAGLRGHWRSVERVLEFMRPFRGSVLLLLLLSFVTVAIELVPPKLMGALVNTLQAAPPQNGPGPLVLLLGIVAALLVVRLTATLVGVWKGYISSRVGTTLTANLRDGLVEKLNELPLAYHDRHQVGMLMSRVAYDTENLHTLVYHMTSGLLLQTLQLVGLGIALLLLNAKLALITMLPMPLIFLGGWYFTRYLNPRNQHYWDAVGKQASALTGMLQGIRVVKAFVQEEREVRRFSESSNRLRDSRQTVDISTATFSAMMGFLFALGNLAVWYIGGRDVLFGAMNLGDLIAFLAYLAMFYTPLTTIGESATWFSNFFTASRRVFEVLDAPGEPRQAEAGMPLHAPQGQVEFQDVSFGYDKNRPVLRDISFRIEAGEMIGVVGRSGSGKSTLVSLMARLYEPDSGRIMVDGIDVRQFGPRQLRRWIGMVPQEPFLFRGLVSENIAYGNAGAAPEEILLAARRADAHDFIMRKPFAYESQLGEGGSGLSGGERQRLSIARALVVDPAILILDEATASVDAESERAICEAIRRFSRRRTSIVIAHRLSTLRDADRLLAFDQGRLLEQGTHDELLARGGVYATLLSIQWNLTENRRRFESAVAPNGSANGGPENGKHELLDLGGEANALASLSGDAPGCRAQSAGGNGRVAGDDGQLHWLAPRAATIAEGLQGLLCVTLGEKAYDDVFAILAFPATRPREFISLRRRDASGREIEVGMIGALDSWDAAAQRAVQRSLARRYLLRRISEIRQVRTRGNHLLLSVLSDGGPANLQLDKSGEGCQSFGPHGLLLVDARGNHYVLPDRRCLPEHQRRLLALYLGD